MGIAVMMLCGTVGTGIINYNGDLGSGMFGLTSKRSSFEKTLINNNMSKLNSQDDMNIASAASKK